LGQAAPYVERYTAGFAVYIVLGSKQVKLFPPPNHKLSLLGAYVAYPLGKVALRVLTIGRYPPEKEPHSALFVASTPWWLFGIVITLLYS
jgi:hypothetical protein